MPCISLFSRVSIAPISVRMEALVPVILDIMRADIEMNPESDVLGLVAYPRINYQPQ